jgi:hypothetical protein
MRIYVGVKERTKPEIFEAETTPAQESYPQYDFTVGPFKTFEDAKRYVGAMGQGVACSEG